MRFRETHEQQRSGSLQRNKKPMPVQAILEWAFRAEKAQLELPDRREPEDRGFGFGTEYILLQRMRLGGVKIDTSPGTSHPHEDAEIVAAAVASLSEARGGKRMAIRVSELARASLTPDWLPDAEPKIEPREWMTNRYGTRGKSEIIGHHTEIVEQVNPRKPTKRIQRSRRHEIRWTPIRWTMTQDRIDAARKEYERWWLALDEIRQALQAGNMLFAHVVTDAMPPRAPWQPRHMLRSAG